MSNRRFIASLAVVGCVLAVFLVAVVTNNVNLAIGAFVFAVGMWVGVVIA